MNKAKKRRVVTILYYVVSGIFYALFLTLFILGSVKRPELFNLIAGIGLSAILILPLKAFLHDLKKEYKRMKA